MHKRAKRWVKVGLIVGLFLPIALVLEALHWLVVTPLQFCGWCSDRLLRW